MPSLLDFLRRKPDIADSDKLQFPHVTASGDVLREKDPSEVPFIMPGMNPILNAPGWNKSTVPMDIPQEVDLPNDEEDATVPAAREVKTEEIKPYVTDKKPISVPNKGDDNYELPNLYSDTDLGQAQGLRNNLGLLALIGKASTNLNSALSSTNQDTSFYNDLANYGQQFPSGIQNLMAAQKGNMENKAMAGKLLVALKRLNPNSTVSDLQRQVVQNMMKTSGIEGEIPSDLSAADLDPMQKEMLGLVGLKRKYDQMKVYNDLNQARWQKNYLRQVDAQANSQGFRETKDFDNSLRVANNLDGLLSQLKAGAKGLKASTVISQALQTDMSQLVTFTKQTAVYDRMHGEIDGIFTRLRKLKQFVNSHPENVIPPAYLQSYEAELDALRKKLFESYDAKTKQQAGSTIIPEKRGIYRNRYTTIAKAYGYDPETHEKLKIEGKYGKVFEYKGNTYYWDIDSQHYLTMPEIQKNSQAAETSAVPPPVLDMSPDEDLGE